MEFTDVRWLFAKGGRVHRRFHAAIRVISEIELWAQSTDNTHCRHMIGLSGMEKKQDLGRNEPCACGSGRKFKNCCLKTQAPSAGHLWHRIRAAIEGLATDLLRCADVHFGPTALFEAWAAFTSGEAGAFTSDTPHLPVFMPWFYYDWLPDPKDTAVNPRNEDALTVAGAYLHQKAKRLEPLRVRYIKQCGEAAFSFHDIVSCQPGHGFVLRDILTGEQVDVTERSGSRQAQCGDILFARVVRLDSVALLEGCAPVLFPPVEKAAILELRKALRSSKRPLTAAVLKNHALDMFVLYREITERLLNPRMPVLQNTDGDPLLFHRLHYEIESPREAFEVLQHLSVTAQEGELLADAQFDTTGELCGVEFLWQNRGNPKHTGWSNTVLGHIKIEGHKLTVEVNSENRARKIRTLIDKLLPGKARYKTTVIESPQRMLAEAQTTETSPASRAQEDAELNALPEVQAQLAQIMRAHYQGWLHEKIPVLKDKTPLQAVKSHDGREMVEALLVQLERSVGDSQASVDASIIKELRAALGLLQDPLL